MQLIDKVQFFSMITSRKRIMETSKTVIAKTSVQYSVHCSAQINKFQCLFWKAWQRYQIYVHARILIKQFNKIYVRTQYKFVPKGWMISLPN